MLDSSGAKHWFKPGLWLAKSKTMSKPMTLLTLFVCLFSTGLVKAAGAADLRKMDIENQQKNIRIIYTEPLRTRASQEILIYKGVAHSVLTEAQMLQLTHDLRAKNFANEFKNDGCYAKSHLISYELSRAGIKHSKVFIYGEKYGDIRVLESEFTKPILFEFHVSPLVLVRLNNRKIIPYVLDFSFFKNPPELNVWLQFFYKDSNLSVLKNIIQGPEHIDPNWTEPKNNLYNEALLYRFETEIDAFLFIISHKKN